MQKAKVSGPGSIVILNRKILPDIPSASGIEMLDGELYIIGDNSPWLFKLNANYEVIDRWLIHKYNDLITSIIPKPVKPDFEAMVSVEYQGKKLLIFGSGSKSPERNPMLQIDVRNPQDIRTFSLIHFYEKLRKEAGLKEAEFNIEAAAADKEKLYLFNRGKNIIFSVTLNDFLNYLNKNAALPEIQCFSCRLPQINGIAAGFSGASITPDEKQLIFSASVENTPNWIDDGEVLGSFVGIIGLSELKNDLQPECIPIMDKENNMSIKVESLAIHRVISKNIVHLLLVTDSDGKSSEILEAAFTMLH